MAQPAPGPGVTTAIQHREPPRQCIGFVSDRCDKQDTQSIRVGLNPRVYRLCHECRTALTRAGVDYRFYHDEGN
jgi:hypothetical protein